MGVMNTSIVPSQHPTCLAPPSQLKKDDRLPIIRNSRQASGVRPHPKGRSVAEQSAQRTCGRGDAVPSFKGLRPQASLVFTGFALFNFAVNAGPNPTTFTLPAEVYPTRLRATGQGLAAACGKVGAAVGIFLLPTLQAAVGLPLVMIVMAALCLVALVTTVVFRVEPKGRSLEDIVAEHAQPQTLPVAVQS
jgi:Sugar (and other) transporter